MLATETQAIAELLKSAVASTCSTEELNYRFGDTRDTLCYATSENQQAVLRLAQESADLAIVVGGYNSSNTSHLVEILEHKFPTYFVKDSAEIISDSQIRHLLLPSSPNRERFNAGSAVGQGRIVTTESWIPAPRDGGTVEILVTAGASCPDAMVEQVIERLCEVFGVSQQLPAVLDSFAKGISEQRLTA
jgi:4-hydroxy-3-methylbut-2-enyl diphosphate reductase